MFSHLQIAFKTIFVEKEMTYSIHFVSTGLRRFGEFIKIYGLPIITITITVTITDTQITIL